MLIDLSLKVTKAYHEDALDNERMASFGHLGTHFDIMNKEFPLKFTNRKAVVFDVSRVQDRDIATSDVTLDMVNENMFVAFYTGFMKKEKYATKAYFTTHPQLSDELIEQLLDLKVSLIGIDCAGIRRGEEHRPKDQYCADRGVFIIENLCNLDKVLNGNNSINFTAHIYPINFADMSGLPCRVIAEIS